MAESEEKSDEKSEEKVGGKRRAEPDKKTEKKDKSEKKAVSASTINTVRNWVATAVWVLAVLAAVILAAAALVIVLDFNPQNGVVSFVRDTAGGLDIFGPFKEFTADKKESKHSVEVKNALVNNGIYAIGYLVVGKLLERLIRP